MALKVIGVSGHMGAGKDTVAALLCEMLRAHGAEVRQFAFATALKDLAVKYFDWDGHKSTDEKVRQHLDTPVYVNLLGGRHLLQGLGVLLRDEVDKHFWIKRLHGAIQKWVATTKAADHYAVIADTRFQEEADSVTWLFHVVRPGYTGDAHPSETIMDTEAFQARVTKRIENKGSLALLRESVGVALSELL